MIKFTRPDFFYCMLLLAFMDGLNIAFIYPLMPVVLQFAKLQGYGESMAYTLSLVSFSTVNFIGIFVYLNALKKVSMKALLVLGSSLAVVGYFLCFCGLYFHHFEVFLLARGLLGFASASLLLAQVYVFFLPLDTSIKASRLSLISVCALTGIATAPVISAVAFSVVGSVTLRYALPFLLLFVLSLILFVSAVLARTELGSIQAVGIFQGARGYWRQLLLRDIPVFVLVMLCWGAIVQSFPLLLYRYLALSPLQLAYVYGFVAIESFLGVMVFRRCARYWSVATIAPRLMEILILAFAVMLVLPVKVSIILSVLVAPVALIPLTASLTSLVVDSLQRERRLSALMVISIATALCMVTSAMLAVQLADLAESALFVGVAAILLLARVSFSLAGFESRYRTAASAGDT